MKKNRMILVIVLLLMTNIFTYMWTSGTLIQAGNKVTVPMDEYQEMKDTYNEYQKVEKLKEYVQKYYLRDVDDKQLTIGQLRGVVSALDDPYSAYLTEEEYMEMIEETEGIFYGIGVIVTGGKDSFITVVSPIDDSPAAEAGIKTGDRIIKVNGEEYYSEDLDQAVKEIRGDKGTKVTLTISRQTDDDMEIFEVDVIRDEIKVETVNYEQLENQLGYIRVSQFDETTLADFKEALNTVQQNNDRGLILDLRNNPGGLLDICVEMADELLDEGTIVYTELRGGQRDATYKSDRKHTDIPLVVLINEGSASASEILAGAIKDRERGKIVGETSFGKGVVQKIVQFPEKDGIKLTVSEYFTPNGVKIHGVGVEPDVEIELPDEAEGFGPEFLETDTQLKKAIDMLTNK